jgi:hypothetical protein
MREIHTRHSYYTGVGLVDACFRTVFEDLDIRQRKRLITVDLKEHENLFGLWISGRLNCSNFPLSSHTVSQSTMEQPIHARSVNVAQPQAEPEDDELEHDGIEEENLEDDNDKGPESEVYDIDDDTEFPISDGKHYINTTTNTLIRNGATVKNE